MLVINRLYEAFLDDIYTITILLPYSYYDGKSTEFFIKDEDNSLEVKETQALAEHMKYICNLSTGLELGKTHVIIDEHGNETDLQIGAVIRSPQFDEKYYYDGNDLGVTYVDGHTIFKVWSPTSTAVKLRLKKQGTDEVKQYDLLRQEKGIWEFAIKGDYDGFFYSFLTCNNLIWNELIDPYAKSVSFNSQWGCVITKEDSKVLVKPLPALSSPTDAIIYELNIRDFSTHPDSGMKHKGKYLSFTEENTRTSNGYSTGVQYLKELGVTHVELLPVNDFGGVTDDKEETRYNWGYNPLYFNAPEGSYSLSPEKPHERINELKRLIQSLHKENIRVILDVVYNHVFIREKSSFEKLVPGYFFRHDENGMPANGTGVGNDFASERLMARKFIVDSIEYWLTEYGVDGFRFDLMGILDVDTMNCIREKVESVLPNAILIGEGWDLNTPIPQEKKANLRNADRIPSIGQFNDRFRDTIKGSTFNLYDKGFALGRRHFENKVMHVLSGSIGRDEQERALFKEPAQSVNYVESHDNHTLWDKLKACLQEDNSSLMKRHRLATAAVLLSQGIPFLHAGQEFYRTKQGVENSYNSGDDINQLNWTDREKYNDYVQFVQELIKIRKSHGAFRFPNVELIKQHVQMKSEKDNLITVHYQNVRSYGPWAEILLIFTSDINSVQYPLPKGEQWICLANGEKASINGMGINKTFNVLLEPVSPYVLVR